MTTDEMAGRISALEVVAAITLNGWGRSHFASAWPMHTDDVLAEARAMLPTTLSEGERAAAEASLIKTFEASKVQP